MRLSRCIFQVYQNFVILRTLNVAMRLKRSLIKLNEAGCNLTRKMCINIYCDKSKKVKVNNIVHFKSQFGNNYFLRLRLISVAAAC